MLVYSSRGGVGMYLEKTQRYKVERALGAGAFGTIQKAHDELLDRTVALKILEPHKFEHENRSLTEARTLAQVNHPNIVVIHEIFEEDGKAYLVTEFVEGETLADLMARGALSLEQTVAIAVKLADGLSAVHKRGIVHSDIKPDNIMVRENGEPVLVDFGIAKLAASADEQATLVGDSVPPAGRIEGTLAYMAPEVIRGDPPTERSDIFSLGTVIYEMLSGRSVFREKTEAGTANAVLTGTPRVLSKMNADLPNEFADLIHRMMAKDSTQRPASMAEIYEELHHWLPNAGRPAQHGWAQDKRVWAGAATILLAFMILWGSGLFPSLPQSTSGLINAGLEELKATENKDAIDRAIKNFEQVLMRDPENAAATAGLSLALSHQYGLTELNTAVLARAKTLAETALALDDQLAISHVAMAWVLEFESMHDAAQTAYEKALLIDPSNFFAFEGYGRLLMENNRPAEAVEIFQKAIVFHPTESILYDQIGSLYFQRQEFDLAEAAFQESINLSPDNVFAYANLSAVHYMRDDIPAAIRVLQQGLQIRPDPVLYTNLGTYYFALGQYPQAVDAFERAVSMKGSSDDYRLWANLADAYRATTGFEDKAASAYRQALTALAPRFQTGTQNPTYYSRAALYHAKAGEVTQAKSRLAEALNLASDDASLLFRAAVTSEIIGERAAALDYIRRALAHGYPLSVIRQDPDLASLRTDGEFLDIVLSHDAQTGDDDE